MTEGMNLLIAVGCIKRPQNLNDIKAESSEHLQEKHAKKTTQTVS